jgi:hypothetical protein
MKKISPRLITAFSALSALLMSGLANKTGW